MTTPREDRYLRISELCNRFATARQIKMDFRRGTGVHLSNQTTQNGQHKVGLTARRPLFRPILTQLHRRARLVFASNQVTWQWRTVLFTDESRFHISTCDRRVRAWDAGSDTRTVTLSNMTDAGLDRLWCGPVFASMGGQTCIS